MSERKPTGFAARVLIVLVLGLVVPPWAVFMLSFVSEHRQQGEEITWEDITDAWCYPDCTIDW